MAATLSFYRLLGLDLPPDADSAPHVEATLPGGLRLMWDSVETVRSTDPDWSPPTPGEGTVAIAFDCGSPSGVDEAYAMLTGHGHAGHRGPWDAFWGQRYAVVLDPDGTSVDLFAALSPGQ